MFEISCEIQQHFVQCCICFSSLDKTLFSSIAYYFSFSKPMVFWYSTYTFRCIQQSNNVPYSYKLFFHSEYHLQEAKNFANRLTAIVDSFVEDARYGVSILNRIMHLEKIVSGSRNYIHLICFFYIDSLFLWPLQLENEIGRCTPIYNIYASVLVNGFCRYTLDALVCTYVTTIISH